MKKKIDNIFIFLKLYRREDSRLLRGIIFVWTALLLISLCLGLIHAGYAWENAVGYEHLLIAESIESGHGFSLPFKVGIYSEQTNNKYFPTAHEEPVYPVLMALLTKILGSYGRPVVLMLQVFALFLTSIVIYFLAKKVFNYSTGLLAGAIISLSPGTRTLAESYYGPAVFAGLLVSVSALLMIRCAENQSFRRSVLLGLSLGFSSLLYAPTLSFLPVSLIFLIDKRTLINATMKGVSVVLISSMMVLSVWTIRNYLTFKQIVPVRTNMGRSICLFNPVLAETFAPDSIPGLKNSGPYWTARDAKEATMFSSSDNKKKRTIYLRGYEIMKKDAPPNFESLNEAEIDKLYFKKGLEFIFAEPYIFIELTYYRLSYFFFSFGLKKTVISVFFLIGTILNLRNRKAVGLATLVAAYLVPYSLAIAWWYRYRYPIEPIMIIFAVYLPILIVSKLHARFTLPKAVASPF